MSMMPKTWSKLRCKPGIIRITACLSQQDNMGQVQDKLEGVEGLEEALPGAEGLPTEAGGAVGGRGGTREKEARPVAQ